MYPVPEVRHYLLEELVIYYRSIVFHLWLDPLAMVCLGIEEGGAEKE